MKQYILTGLLITGSLETYAVEYLFETPKPCLASHDLQLPGLQSVEAERAKPFIIAIEQERKIPRLLQSAEPQSKSILIKKQTSTRRPHMKIPLISHLLKIQDQWFYKKASPDGDLGKWCAWDRNKGEDCGFHSLTLQADGKPFVKIVQKMNGPLDLSLPETSSPLQSTQASERDLAELTIESADPQNKTVYTIREIQSRFGTALNILKIAMMSKNSDTPVAEYKSINSWGPTNLDKNHDPYFDFHASSKIHSPESEARAEKQPELGILARASSVMMKPLVGIEFANCALKTGSLVPDSTQPTEQVPMDLLKTNSTHLDH